MRARALILALATAALASWATPASATTIKTLAGATLASNSSFTGTLKAGTVWHIEGGSGGDFDCASSALGGQLGINPAIPSVTASLTALTVGSCTDTIPFLTLSSVTTNVGTGSAAKPAAFTYLGSGSSLTLLGRIEFTLTFASGSTCVYEVTASGATATHDSNTSPWNNEYVFTDVPMTKTGGTYGFCPTVSWSAIYVLTSGGAGITIQP
ncbi:MAG TPA: hypothetical protein VF529_14190 [Solirubrobacteraceae bacterium]|jgi:hypothetical protein